MKIIIALLSALTITSCMLVDNFNEEPMYLDIQDITFTSDDSTLSRNDSITDVWVFIDGVSRGVHPLPAIVPVLGDQDVDITLFAGIRESGQQFVANQYPFYDRMELVLPFQAGLTVPLEFETRYVDGTTIAFRDDFEDLTQINVDLDGDLSSTIVMSEETPFGEFAGRIDVNSESTAFQQASNVIFNTNDFGNREVFLELDHNNDVGFIVGITGSSGSTTVRQAAINLFPNEGWEKLYLNLSIVLELEQVDEFQILIAGDGMGESGTILIDNMRLLHF